MENKKETQFFLAVDSALEVNIVKPTEKVKTGGNMVSWGDGNIYPDYLLGLYNEVTTLRSIVNGNVDFITGDDVTILPLGERFANGVMNKRGDTIREQIKDLARDYEIYGGFALQIIRSLDGNIAEIYYIDMRFLRTNKKGDVFYYHEEWKKRTLVKKAKTYPAFIPNLDWASLDEEGKKLHMSSILYVKNIRTQVYPAPLYAAAVKDCEIERCVDSFHLNAIENGFTSSAILSFNNGVPNDEQKQCIEDEVNEKFTGHQNAGRLMISFSKDRTTAPTITEFKIEDFGERYQSLSEHSRQQLFTAFRAAPALFGIIDKTGFNETEYESAFKLYNRTQIQPIQKMMADTYDKIYGSVGVLTITPFSLEGKTEDKVN